MPTSELCLTIVIQLTKYELIFKSNPSENITLGVMGQKIILPVFEGSQIQWKIYDVFSLFCQGFHYRMGNGKCTHCVLSNHILNVSSSQQVQIIEKYFMLVYVELVIFHLICSNELISPAQKKVEASMPYHPAKCLSGVIYGLVFNR